MERETAVPSEAAPATADDAVPDELHVFDFDGTLIDTPTPEVGMQQYLEATGEDWPFQGWWGRAESLEAPLTMAEGPAFEEYKVSAQNSRVVTIMMTGRRSKLKDSVESVMRDFEIQCHEHIFNATGHNTLTYKMNELRRLVAKYKPRRVRIWEDRTSHAGIFQEMEREFKSIAWDVTLVEPSNDF
jgi:hypothetical protein